MFWQYNLQWNTPELLSIPQLGQDSGFTPIYNIPMMWDDDVPLSYTGGVEVVSPADSSREPKRTNMNTIPVDTPRATPKTPSVESQ